MLQLLAQGAAIMRYEFPYKEWSIIRPMLPTKPRGVPRVAPGELLGLRQASKTVYETAVGIGPSGLDWCNLCLRILMPIEFVRTA